MTQSNYWNDERFVIAKIIRQANWGFFTNHVNAFQDFANTIFVDNIRRFFTRLASSKYTNQMEGVIDDTMPDLLLV